jgi:hypothetical protein
MTIAEYIRMIEIECGEKIDARTAKAMMSRDAEHGESGHLNVFVKDQDSVVTGYGKHERVVCFLPRGNEMYMRVDVKYGLPIPTESDMLSVARKDQNVRGRWNLTKKENWSYGGVERIDCHFQRG